MIHWVWLLLAFFLGLVADLAYRELKEAAQWVLGKLHDFRPPHSKED